MSILCVVFISIFSQRISFSQNFIPIASPSTEEEFHQFLQLFPDGTLPINITFDDLEDEKSVREIGMSNFLSRRIFNWKRSSKVDKRREQLLIRKYIGDPMLVRMPVASIPICKFQPSEDKHAVIYARERSENFTIYMKLFDERGNELERHVLACELSNGLTSISSNYIFEQKDFQCEGNLFETKGGKLFCKRKLKEIKHYKIDKSGKFKLLEQNCDKSGA